MGLKIPLELDLGVSGEASKRVVARPTCGEAHPTCRFLVADILTRTGNLSRSLVYLSRLLCREERGSWREGGGKKREKRSREEKKEEKKRSKFGLTMRHAASLRQK